MVYSWYCGWRIWQNWKGLRFESNHIKLVSFSILTFELYDPELDMQTYICFSDLLENDTKAIHSAFKFALGKCALLCVNILWLYGYKIVTNGWLIVVCICILKSESWINILFVWWVYLSLCQDDAPRPGQPGQGPRPAGTAAAPVRT